LPLEAIAERYIPDNIVYPTGFSIFDYAMDGGVRGGELITISAPSGHGKTTIAQQLTGNFTKAGTASLWFSYEMNPYYLKDNFVKANIELGLIYAPMYIEMDIVRELDSIENLIARAKKDYDCRIVFIDHLHYLVPLQQAMNVSLMIGGIVRELKQIAVKQNVVIFLIAHAKKIYQGEKMDASSIRDSGLIVNESDFVFILEREKKAKGMMEKNDTEWENKTKISLAKNRRTGDMRFITCNHINRKFIEISNEYENIKY
jgi:replicative DNA helicase